MNPNSERGRMMEAVQVAAFALYDTTLYLDTHPTCARGLEYYQQARRNLERAQQQYEARFGPLTANQANNSGGRWAWTELSWPWEMER